MYSVAMRMPQVGHDQCLSLAAVVSINTCLLMVHTCACMQVSCANLLLHGQMAMINFVTMRC